MLANIIALIRRQIATFLLGAPVLLAGIISPGIPSLAVQGMSIACGLLNLDDIKLQTPESGECMVLQLNVAYQLRSMGGPKVMTLMDLMNISAACPSKKDRPRPVCMVHGINNFFFGS